MSLSKRKNPEPSDLDVAEAETAGYAAAMDEANEMIEQLETEREKLRADIGRLKKKHEPNLPATVIDTVLRLSDENHGESFLRVHVRTGRYCLLELASRTRQVAGSDGWAFLPHEPELFDNTVEFTNYGTYEITIALNGNAATCVCVVVFGYAGVSITPVHGNLSPFTIRKLCMDDTVSISAE